MWSMIEGFMRFTARFSGRVVGRLASVSLLWMLAAVQEHRVAGRAGADLPRSTASAERPVGRR